MTHFPRPARFLLAFAVIMTIAARTAAAASYDKMIVFGDSLSDNGNLATAVGPGLLASLNYDPFRVTDGPTTSPATSMVGVTVERLNTLLGLPTLTPALQGGSNYAWAFATTGFNGLDVPSLMTPGTGAQVAAYLALNPLASPSSLYVLWAGANDFLGATSLAGIQAAETVAIANLNTQLSLLLAAGARNILWFNLPDLSLTPRANFIGGPLAAQLHDSSLKFRDDWSSSLAQLAAAYPTATLTGVDVYSALNAMFTQPSLFGLANVTTPAQGLGNVNPDQFLFWDDVHPTTKGHAVLASVAFQQLQLQPVPEPSTYGIGAAAIMIGVAFMRRRRNRSGR